ncbi:Protein MEI2-like 6 (OML6) (MEI2-like protein 6) [Durusdinium trenchii]|uniref:Protein MEI2-like 6 (OML6) (MEI2-like protein 6) n=1 Tax=Durusdinium trenchii TaxID=1381693 RepID=A0ABP0IHB1_9DINO
MLGLSKLYDFAYLPRDFNAVDNKGYAFVNFVSPETAQMFRRRVQESGFLSTIKAPVVADAVVQGLDANLKKWCGQRLNRIRNPELKPYVSPEALQSMGQRESSAAFSTTARQIKAQQIGEVAVLKARAMLPAVDIKPTIPIS